MGDQRGSPASVLVVGEGHLLEQLVVGVSLQLVRLVLVVAVDLRLEQLMVGEGCSLAALKSI